MERKEFVLQSSYDGLQLKGTIYEPKGEKKAIVQLVHGMCEHKGRYEEYMQFLAEHGYVAACHDHRGHGDSVEKEEDRGWFHDFDGKAIVDDAVAVTEYLKGQYPNLPVVLFGHSMGSMVVRCYLQEHDDKIQKLIVCGSPSQNPLAGIAIFMTKCIRLFKGERHRSKMLAYLSTGKGDKKFKGEGKGAWLSRNRENIALYATDPKCKFIFTCNGFENLFKLMKNTYDKKKYKVKNPNLPIRFVSGSEDAVLVNERKWREAIESMRKIGYTNATGVLYEGMRHEILNELGREEVYQDLNSFLEN